MEPSLQDSKATPTVFQGGAVRPSYRKKDAYMWGGGARAGKLARARAILRHICDCQVMTGCGGFPQGLAGTETLMGSFFEKGNPYCWVTLGESWGCHRHPEASRFDNEYECVLLTQLLKPAIWPDDSTLSL